MSSVISDVLDEIETRLKTISGVVSVLRVLQGRSYAPAETNSGAFPSIALRITGDEIESAQNKKARVSVHIDIEVLVIADSSFSDTTLINLIWSIRHVIGVDEDPPINGLLRRDAAIEWRPVIYGYPDAGSFIAMARQPISLHLIEQY